MSLSTLGTQNPVFGQQPARPEVVVCLVCDGKYFTERKVTKYLMNHSIVLGQQVPVDPTSFTFTFLECARCHNYIEPSILYDPRELASSDYQDVLDTLHGKNDKRDK